MYADMTAEDLDEWEAYYMVDPWGEYRRDLQAGVVAAAALAPHCKRGQAPRASDFLLFADKPAAPRQTEPQMKSIAATIAKRWNPNG